MFRALLRVMFDNEKTVCVYLWRRERELLLSRSARASRPVSARARALLPRATRPARWRRSSGDEAGLGAFLSLYSRARAREGRVPRRERERERRGGRPASRSSRSCSRSVLEELARAMVL